MDSEFRDGALKLFEKIDGELEKLTPRRKKKVDSIRIVFVDSVNGKIKSHNSLSLLEVLEDVKDGSKPVGMILVDWDDPDSMESRTFPGVSDAEQQLVLNEFAEVQDQEKEDFDAEI